MSKHLGLLGLGLVFITSVSLAESSAHFPPPFPLPLNKITFQLSAEDWVKTQTALVTITIDASLNQAGMDNLQAEVSHNLNELASSANWQMVDYQRNQDSSGLETIHMTEQARLSPDQLTQIRSHTTALSKPGIRYTVANIDFVPSLSEIEGVKAHLRENLDIKIADEISFLNKTYHQNFTVHHLVFYTGEGQPLTPTPMVANYKMANLAVTSSPTPTSLSQKMVMNALVTVAGPIDQND